MTRENPKGHPARYSPEIISEFADILKECYPVWFGRPALFDPFAGTGEALHDLALSIDFPYGGVEIEPEFIVAPGIREGDATEWTSYPPPPYVIVTSPVYPNGIADAWNAKDGSKRFTYQNAKDLLVGEHTELHENNAGRYGYRGTKRGGKSVKREGYWRVAELAVNNWRQADMVLLNVSDFKVKGGATEPFVMDWRKLLEEYGWVYQKEIQVGTARIGMGSNAEKRVEHEVIVVAKR